MAYTYTDLTLKMQIDPRWLADNGTIYVGLEPANGTAVEVTASSVNLNTGIITAELTQAQTALLDGIVQVQCNGFLDGSRWATQKVPIMINQNVIRRVINNA